MFQQRRCGDSRRGAIAVLAAILMVLVVGMVAFAVDLSNLCVVRAKAQAIADAAALAGGRGLAVSSTQAQTLAKACANQNTVNGQTMALQSSNVVVGTWSTTAHTFTALAGTAASQANACKVNVTLTAANGNPVSMLFAGALGVHTADVTASAVAGGGRWDIVLVCDISSSFSADLAQATSGMTAVLNQINQYSPTSNLGIVTFTGQTQTVASLQPVGSNYSSLATAINNIQDCAAPGGPACCGSDLAAGMATGISLFSAAGYNPPTGTRKAIIFISDGAANISGGCVNSSLSDAGDNSLAATEAQNAWTSKAINVFSLLYYHGSDSRDPPAVPVQACGRPSRPAAPHRDPGHDRVRRPPTRTTACAPRDPPHWHAILRRNHDRGPFWALFAPFWPRS